MASVSSLDQDMKRLRLGRYTPQAAEEARAWIEDTLGEKLPSGDLLQVLKDGTVLCRLANLIVPPPGIRFKTMKMPFVQMENISHFLKACEQPPLNLHAHDRFLTVDLYEAKDPAQVLQCLGAFSRVANSIDPSKFKTAIGPKKSGTMSPGLMSPAATGSPSGRPAGFGGRSRATSNASQASTSTLNTPAPRALSPAHTGGSFTSRGSTRSPTGPVSSWSKRNDEKNTAPAWNIHQYGYMGGASQGNQGVMFGGRRQITSAAPHVPSVAEKERKRREQEAETERLRIQSEEAEHKRRVEREAEEEREKAEEERKWEEQTRQAREEERMQVEEQKREWEEQERKWKEDEEKRQRDEKEAQEKLEQDTQRKRATSDARLRGQFLSQYQAEQAGKPRSRQGSRNDPEISAERQKILDLERQLEAAKERERQYQLEREERSGSRSGHSRAGSVAEPPRPASPPDSQVSWAGDEREYLRQQWTDQQEELVTPRPLPEPTPSSPPSLPARPLPEPTTPNQQATSPRPLPNPSDYISAKTPLRSPQSNRTDRFLSSNPAPLSPKPATHYPVELGLTTASEHQAEDARRQSAQTKTKAAGWASKSLLEREMERERERQREWEEGQKKSRETKRDTNEGVGPGQSWDVNQYGFTGGDSQNKVGSGIGFGGRRQIIGPRPRP
ncbi:hypothetical protein K490DRAFT_32145 [Saccharata proteae CBS 121410]|uniref:Calponin-homology (CH) domain-containing protein n=1 Tax=Saccharata proteae CBS 121410 TaxID=1314787 RepID=A0A9P4I341_9PEZI|nr:hypothetical protein K490DRAFT_32145 [Saccharata proteae CBS 121410]